MAADSLATRSTLRELSSFILVGGLQYVVDVAVFGLVQLTTGQTVAANVLGRATGAVCGYFLNGVFTFRTLGRTPGRFGLRFLTAWLFMTALSTAAIQSLGAAAAGQAASGRLVRIKAGVELLLFVASFLVHKYWIFVRRAAGPPPPGAAPDGGALFLLAHADDEFFFAPRIRQLVAVGRPVYCVYATDGAGRGTDPAVRQRESARALAQLGVPETHQFCLGVAHGIPDGQAHRAVTRLAAIVEEFARARPLAEIYVPAWEGGHADHDATHLVGVALARALGVPRVWECPSYHACSRLPFRVMHFIPRVEPAEMQRLTLAEGLFLFGLIGSYRSQWRTWLGLGPEAFWRLVVQRRHPCRRVAGIDYTQPPHAGPLLYETRFGVSFAEFRAATAEFVATRVAAAPLGATCGAAP